MPYDIKDLIVTSIEDDVHGFKNALSDALNSKINDAIDEYKVAVAQSIFEPTTEEQIDELSTGTIRSYMKKATKSAADAKMRLSGKRGYVSRSKKNDLEHTIDKRKAGTNRAINSLLGGKRKEVFGNREI